MASDRCVWLSHNGLTGTIWNYDTLQHLRSQHRLVARQVGDESVPALLMEEQVALIRDTGLATLRMSCPDRWTAPDASEVRLL